MINLVQHFRRPGAHRIDTIVEYAPPYIAIPASGYGGTERVVAGICDHFRRANVDFRLWASGDSYRDENGAAADFVHATAPEALGFDKPFEANIRIQNDLHNLRRAMRGNPHMAAHMHLEDAHIPVLGADPSIACRTLTTLHNPAKDWYADYPDMPMVAISEAQKTMLGLDSFNFVRVVHNGVDENLYRPRYDIAPDAPLTFLGRFSPDKGPDDAVKIAQATGHAIRLAGPKDNQYPDCFEQIVRHRMQEGVGQVEYAGLVTDEHDPALGMSSKNGFLADSKALLFPIRWKEPFGLVAVEANACGTPVIAYNHPGSAVDELIEDGVNGFKVDTFEDACEAVRNLGRIDRRQVREHFERRFTSAVMAEKYRRILQDELPSYRRHMTRRSPSAA